MYPIFVTSPHSTKVTLSFILDLLSYESKSVVFFTKLHCYVIIASYNVCNIANAYPYFRRSDFKRMATFFKYNFVGL